MNVTVIPFLLGAIVSVDNTAKWNFGPEYVFELNKTTVLYMETRTTEELTATVKCRPKVPFQSSQNVLICCIQNITFLTIFGHEDPNITTTAGPVKIPEQLFEMEFNAHGVQRIKRKKKENKPNSYNKDIASWIAEQLNVGTDLSVKTENSMKRYQATKAGSHIINFYNENTMKASKCNTSYIITLYEYYFHRDKKLLFPDTQTNFNFQLVLLPMADTNSVNKTSFSIERSRLSCTQLKLRNIKLLNNTWKIDKVMIYFNKMEIKDMRPKFTSYTKLEGKLYSKRFSRELVFSMFRETVHLNLIDIKPAENKRFTY